MSGTAGDRIGTVLCGLFLGALNAVLLFATFTLFVVWLFLAADSAGAVSEHRDTVLLVLPSALVLAGLTWVFVKAEWLRTWWYAVPAVSAALAVPQLLL